MNEESISFEEIYNMDIDNMKKIKYKAIKNKVINKLEKFLNHIKNDELDEAYKMLKHSPAGDDMGCDNMFITFGGQRSKWDDNERDLGDMIEKMKECK